MNKKIVVLLGIILFIAAILRLWDLGNVPISPDWDEAALGYNAYSILHTGRDEYSKFLPIILRSFDDYKPALYAYFAIPPIALFGLNTFAVRFPSAVFGILAVIGTFFLVKELFPKAKQFSIFNFQFSIAEIVAFLLAISPWHIQFSRIAFESNVGLTFNIFSAVFFLKGLKKPWFLLLSSFLMAINIYIYQSEKVFSPILLLLLIVIFRKEFFAISKKYTIVFVLIGILVCLPMLVITVSDKNALGRAKGVSIFSESTKLLEENSRKLLEDVGLFDDDAGFEVAFSSFISSRLTELTISLNLKNSLDGILTPAFVKPVYLSEDTNSRIVNPTLPPKSSILTTISA